MKKMLHKRKIAVFIDYFSLGMVLTLISYLGRLSSMPEWILVLEFEIGAVPVTLPSFGFFILLFVIGAKDCLFRNASLGKKIMGLRIVTEEGMLPPLKTIWKRGIVMQTIGYTTYIKYRFTEGDIVEWELQHLKTKVVSKRQYKEYKKG